MANQSDLMDWGLGSWDGGFAQGGQATMPVEDMSQHFEGSSMVDSSNSGRHASGHLTNAAADPDSIAGMHAAVFIIVASMVGLILMGAVAFKGANF